MCLLDGFLFALLLESVAQFDVLLGQFAAQLFRCFLRFFLKVRFTTVQIIKTTCDFACHFQMRYLILTDRYMLRAVNQNIRRLQQRIAQKAVG